MQIWIPTKKEIEELLQKVLNKLQKSDTVWEIEGWVEDELIRLNSHVSNRAMLEVQDLKESK